MASPPDASGIDTVVAALLKILPGAVGAAVSLRTLPPESTWTHRVLALVGGVAVASYGAPALAEALEITSPRIEAFSAFALGLFGMALASEISAALRETQLGLIVRDWVRKVLRLDRG